MANFQVPDLKKVRVIIDTDAKTEADDQYAIVHACLTPKLIIKGLVATHFGKYPDKNAYDNSDRKQEVLERVGEAGLQAILANAGKSTMEASYQECIKLLDLMEKSEEIPVYRGAEEAMKSLDDYEYSEGSAFIVDEAMRESKYPLFVIALGAITNVACALREHPEIAERFTLIWIGGGAYPSGGKEFNMGNDIVAANVIMKSDVELWQVPINVYSKMLVSLTELEEKVYPYGKVGKYLFEQMVEFNDRTGWVPGFPRGENWSLGDSPTVGLLMDPHEYAIEYREAPIIEADLSYRFDGNGRQIRVYNDINTRFVLEDMFAKLKKNYG